MRDRRHLRRPAAGVVGGSKHIRHGSQSPGGGASGSVAPMTGKETPTPLPPASGGIASFLRKWEVPRKSMHSSMGLVTLLLYRRHWSPDDFIPMLEMFFVPVVGFDVVRFRVPALNRAYCALLGPLMRESETNNWNGVISYVIGSWVVLRFFPLDMAIVSILLLAYCDTVASWTGRSLGHWGPRIRSGKSLMGAIGSFIAGTLATYSFYAFCTLPNETRFLWTSETSHLSLVALSMLAGLAGSFSEVIDIFHLDDNVVIPIVSGSLLYAAAWLAKM